MDYEEISKKIYNACLKAALETGDSYKKISWFTRNKIAEAEQEIIEELGER